MSDAAADEEFPSTLCHSAAHTHTEHNVVHIWPYENSRPRNGDEWLGRILFSVELDSQQ